MIDGFAPLLRVLRSTGWSLRGLPLAALLGTGAILAAVGLLTTSGYLISRAAQQPEILTLMVAIVGVRFFSLLRALLRYAERLVSHDVALRAIGDIRRRFFAALVPLVPAGLGSHRRGELLSRFVADVDRLQDLYLRALLPPLIALGAGAGSVLIALLIFPPAAAVLVVFLLAGALLVPSLTRLAARRAGRRQAAARAALNVDLLEVAAGAPEISLAGREDDWAARVRDSDGRLAAIQRSDAVAAGLGGGLGTALAAGAAIAMAAVALPAVSDGTLAGVLLAAVALLGMASYESVAPLPAAAASIDACASAADRLDQLTSTRPPVAEPASPTPATEPALRGPLRIDGVSFAYEPDVPILAGADLRLERGQAVALRGPSGSGKSTLAELLVRFLDPLSGSVTLGGVALSRFADHDLRAAVLLAGQDAYLFAVSIRENLLLGDPSAGEPEMLAALERVGLGEWLRDLPAGIDTSLGEGGAGVSGGQRQRIAIARALLSPAPFLIFDEPTAHIDGTGSAALLGELAREAHVAGRGVLVISHETEGLESFDSFVSLAAGRLIRRATP